ncbi:MAG: UDP binding domain-containing protein, partial [Planctomycetaceae bacterium]
MIQTAEEHGVEPRILKAVDAVNTRQKEVLFDKLHRHFGGDLKGKAISIWGLSFKPRTDDVREAPALVLIDKLLQAGAYLRVHDPVAMENVREKFGDRIVYCEHHYDTLEAAEALCIVTEWAEFRNPDFGYMKHKMKSPVVFDGRNLFDPEKMRSMGFYYSGIGLHNDEG